jgi:predicted secreted protein
MLPVKSIRISLGTLLAADATSLAPATDPNEIALITAPFVPTENLVIGDLTFGSGNGLDPIVGVAGTQNVGVNPLTQEQVVTIKEPAGGWRWQLTGAPSPAVTIYGIALTTTAGAALLGTQVLDNPVTMTNIGDEYNAGSVNLTFVLTPLS